MLRWLRLTLMTFLIIFLLSLLFFPCLLLVLPLARFSFMRGWRFLPYHRADVKAHRKTFLLLRDPCLAETPLGWRVLWQ